jgi:TolB-like protein/Tfp pilus assembly protein PilF
MERMALPLPDKPSIVVLPLVNMSNDSTQDYFADGITDDLITELSKLPGLFVIARNTSFHYKGKAIKISQVAEELGVRYVLEGSVQRAGDRLRINAQLIDALSGGHVWADRFDGSLADVFQVQDQVTKTTAEALALRLTSVQKASIALQETPIPEAYEAFLHGWDHYRRTTPSDYAKSIPYFEKAIAIDPNYSRAYAALAMVYIRSAGRYWTDSFGMTIRQARTEARRNLQKSLRKPSALSHQAAGYFSLNDYSPNDALAEFKEAIALDPSDSWSYALAAFALTGAERPEEAISYINAAVRLDPHPPALFLYYLGMAQFNMERYETAAKSLEDATQLNPNDEYSYLALAATYGHLGKPSEANSTLNHYNALVVARGGTPATTNTYSDFYYLDGSPQYKRLSLGLKLAGAPDNLGSGVFADQNRLSKDEIRTLILGHEAHGYSIVDGTERAAMFATGGRASISGDWASSLEKPTGGTIDFKGDELCMKFDFQLYCGAILRNPGGTRAKENEFIWLSGHAYPFSLVN